MHFLCCSGRNFKLESGFTHFLCSSECNFKLELGSKYFLFSSGWFQVRRGCNVLLAMYNQENYSGRWISCFLPVSYVQCPARGLFLQNLVLYGYLGHWYRFTNLDKSKLVVRHFRCQFCNQWARYFFYILKAPNDWYCEWEEVENESSVTKNLLWEHHDSTVEHWNTWLTIAIFFCLQVSSSRRGLGHK